MRIFVIPTTGSRSVYRSLALASPFCQRLRYLETAMAQNPLCPWQVVIKMPIGIVNPIALRLLYTLTPLPSTMVLNKTHFSGVN